MKTDNTEFLKIKHCNNNNNNKTMIKLYEFNRLEMLWIELWNTEEFEKR